MTFATCTYNKEKEEWYIPFWGRCTQGVFLSWKENETVKEMMNRNEMYHYDDFHSHIDPNISIAEQSLEYPYSVTVYEMKSHYLITKSPLSICDDLFDAVVLEKNGFNYIRFFKEMCIPFLPYFTLEEDD